MACLDKRFFVVYTPMMVGKRKKIWSTEDLLRLPSSRAEAKSLNQLYYYRRKPCNHGHIAPYYASTGQCYECGLLRAKMRYKLNPEETKKYNRAMHHKHRKKRLEMQKEYKRNNPEIIKALNDKRDKKLMAEATALWRLMNPEKAKESNKQSRIRHRKRRADASRLWRQKNKQRVSKYQRDYRKANYDQVRAYEQSHYNKARRHMPKWVITHGFTKDIIRIYKQRDSMNESSDEKYHVDHIVPLTGKHHGQHVVCGLHVPWNLQVITADKNLKKSNPFDPWK